jgi:hypothetical protein
VDPSINPIAPTSRWMAAARARESERADRLFCDPLAAALAGPEGSTWLERMEVAAQADGPALYPVIRTRFFDDFLLDSCRRLGVRQVVLAAAGLDTRAFRLRWPSGTRLYEMDLLEVLNTKEDVIDRAGAKPNCERLTLGVDLNVATWGLFFSPVAWPMQAALAQCGAPGRFGTNNPETLMARHGWEADVTQPGEEGANFGRWPRPMVPRDVPSIPRSFLVRARRS